MPPEKNPASMEIHLLLNRYIFRRGEFKTWQFAFGPSDIRTLGCDLKGFEYLARLISSPRTWISPIELVTIKESPDIQCGMAHDVNDFLLDSIAFKSIRERQAFLINELSQREDSRLEQELRTIGEYLNRAYRPGGQAVTLGTPRMKKACQSVQNAIKRALMVLWESNLEELAQHLTNCARPDNYAFVYREENPPAWDVNWLSPARRS